MPGEGRVAGTSKHHGGHSNQSYYVIHNKVLDSVRNRIRTLSTVKVIFLDQGTKLLITSPMH